MTKRKSKIETEVWKMVAKKWRTRKTTEKKLSVTERKKSSIKKSQIQMTPIKLSENPPNEFMDIYLNPTT